MKDIVLITGASGHLAKALSRYLSKDYIVKHLTTKKILSSQDSCFHWDIQRGYIDYKALENCKHIIHLAGFPILNWWTKKNKQIMYDSRIATAKLILDGCKRINNNPKTFISASAIGIYEKSLIGDVHENSQKGRDWLARMVRDWEDASNKFKAIGSRVVQLRFSLIFSKEAGFLKYNLFAMKFGIGAIIGNPKRKINWMHVEDITRLIKESITNKEYTGPYNLACDDKISQKEFITKIRRHLFPYALIVRIPMFLMNWIIGGRSQIIKSNLNLNTKKIKGHGFKFKVQ